jgi:hypothetical protein
MLEGNTIEIVKAQGLENRRYLWVPSLNAVFGGVLIFSGCMCGRPIPRRQPPAPPG